MIEQCGIVAMAFFVFTGSALAQAAQAVEVEHPKLVERAAEIYAL